MINYLASGNTLIKNISGEPINKIGGDQVKSPIIFTLSIVLIPIPVKIEDMVSFFLINFFEEANHLF